MERHAEEPEQGPPTYHWWHPEFYRYLFNVDSNEVGQRLVKSLIIGWPPNFLSIVRQNPDLYGPFWITTTVVFLMAAAGNFASYLNWAFQHNSCDSPWEYNFNYVSVSAFAIYCYNFILPVILWGVCKVLDINLSLLDCLCIYGYALFVFIPVALLSVAPSEILRWALVGIAGFISCAFLGSNLFYELRANIRYGTIITAVIVVLHIGLALTFKLYFFQSIGGYTNICANSTTAPNSTATPFPTTLTPAPSTNLSMPNL